ncbi:MAG: ATP-binding protein [Calditrichota bacterium]
MNSSGILNRRGFIYLLLVVGITTLIILNFWGWFLVRGLEDRIAIQLGNQLRQTAELYARDIGARYLTSNISTLSPADEPLNTSLPIALYDYKRQAELQTIFVAALDRRFSIDDRLSPGSSDVLESFLINDSLFSLATVGADATTEMSELSGEYFLTAYAPIFNEFDEVTGVLILEAPATLFTTLRFFRQNLTLMGIGGILLIALFAAIIMLAIRRLLGIERELTAKTRLAHLGQMAAMVAHEIRNPLSIIKGSADVLRKKYAKTEDELFDFIPDEIDRLNRLVNDFLQFARKREPDFSSVQPAEVLRSLSEQMQDPRINFTTDSDKSIQLDADAFRQVMLNIIENARQATPDNGVIEICCKEQQRPQRMRIEVKDNGVGMDAETLAQIFDPFFSTRATGSGLGMAITRQLIEQMKGEITVESKPGDGTVVRMEFSG